MVYIICYVIQLLHTVFRFGVQFLVYTTVSTLISINSILFLSLPGQIWSLCALRLRRPMLIAIVTHHGKVTFRCEISPWGPNQQEECIFTSSNYSYKHHCTSRDECCSVYLICTDYIFMVCICYKVGQPFFFSFFFVCVCVFVGGGGGGGVLFFYRHD